MGPERHPVEPDPGDPPAPEPPPWAAFDELEEHEEPDRPNRGRRLLVLAAIPWAVVAVVMFRTVTGTPPSAATPSAATPSPAAPAIDEAAADPVSAPDPEAPQGASHATGGGPVAMRFGVRVTPGPGDVAATAILAARAWLGDVGPEPVMDVGSAEGPPVYVEHLVVEAVDLPTADTAVATVVAIVLDAAEGAYTSARTVRLAVPVALDRSGAYPAGEPWWLPSPDLRSRPPTWTPVEDPELLTRAGTALETAGYRDVAVTDLAAAPTWPLRVTATAVAPGSDTPHEHVVWLRDHLGDLVVAGALPPTQGPVQQPTEQEDRR